MVEHLRPRKSIFDLFGKKLSVRRVTAKEIITWSLNNGFQLCQKRKNCIQNANCHTGVKWKTKLKNSLCSTTQTLLHSAVPRSVMYPEATQSWSVSPGHDSQKPPLLPYSKLHNSPSSQSAVVSHTCSPLKKLDYSHWPWYFDHRNQKFPYLELQDFGHEMS